MWRNKELAWNSASTIKWSAAKGAKCQKRRLTNLSWKHKRSWLLQTFYNCRESVEDDEYDGLPAEKILEKTWKEFKKLFFFIVESLLWRFLKNVLYHIARGEIFLACWAPNEWQSRSQNFLASRSAIPDLTPYNFVCFSR